VNFLIEKGHIKKGNIVVDIPCGTGDMAKAIAKKVYVGKFLLIDINKEMIKSAKRKVQQNIQTIVGDAGDVEKLVDSNVDTILCLNGFHQYINRKEDFLKGCKNILKREGRLIFDVSTRGLHDKRTKDFLENQEKEAIKLSAKFSVQAKFPSWPNEKILEKYRTMIKEQGLQLVEEHEFTFFRTISEVLSRETRIPGRSRPWFPGLNYNERKEILEKSIKKTVEKLGEQKIEQNRIFFILEA